MAHPFPVEEHRYVIERHYNANIVGSETHNLHQTHHVSDYSKLGLKDLSEHIDDETGKVDTNKKHKPLSHINCETLACHTFKVNVY